MVEDGEQRIREGFPGQRSIVLPRPVVSGWLEGRPLIELLPSDVGHYPKAQWHFVERPEGISQSVLIYCTDGGGWARLGGSTLRIRPGQALVMPAGAMTLPGAQFRFRVTQDDLAGADLPTRDHLHTALAMRRGEQLGEVTRARA